MIENVTEINPLGFDFYVALAAFREYPLEEKDSLSFVCGPWEFEKLVKKVGGTMQNPGKLWGIRVAEDREIEGILLVQES